jgi:hypothetical protein
MLNEPQFGLLQVACAALGAWFLPAWTGTLSFGRSLLAQAPTGPIVESTRSFWLEGIIVVALAAAALFAVCRASGRN